MLMGWLIKQLENHNKGDAIIYGYNSKNGATCMGCIVNGAM